MKMFVGAAKDRLDSLMATPAATPSMHMRTLSLLVVILVNNVVGMGLLWSTVDNLTWTKLLLFGFDTAIIAVDGSKTLLRWATCTAWGS